MGAEMLRLQSGIIAMIHRMRLNILRLKRESIETIFSPNETSRGLRSEDCGSGRRNQWHAGGTHVGRRS